MGSELKLAMTTCDSRELADRLATTLVERRLAACVNVLPGVRSAYRWAGTVEHAEEVLLMIKTTQAELSAVEATIRSISGYELPEFVAVEITGGSADYLAWLAASVGEDRQ